jgi:H/ACA ribonucleoprotein complex subunit 3
MKSLLFRCPKCSRYTMEARCPSCGEVAKMAAPAKYSPDDKYARYRSPLAYQSAVEEEEDPSSSARL